MGVYPEPALCADDVCRFVPNGSAGSSNAQRNTARSAARKTRGTMVLIAALAFGASPIALAHDGGAQGSYASQIYSDQDVSGRLQAWGGTDLKAQEPATQSVIDSNPASSPEDKPGADMIRFGERYVPRAIVETILRASAAAGVDPVYMMALADKESSFRTAVKSSASSAQGLFQFITGTWLEMIRDHGAKHGLVAEAAAIQGRGPGMRIADPAMRQRILSLRNDPYVAGLMAGELIKRDRRRIEAKIGREMKTTELYVAHFLGTSSAGKFLTFSAENPDVIAQKEFACAARANRSIFTAKDEGKSRSLTVAEVHGRLHEMIDRRMNTYEEVLELAAEPEPKEQVVDAPLLDARLRVMGAVPSLMTSSFQ